MLFFRNAWALASQPALAQIRVVDLVDGDLRPQQDPVAVGHLFDLGVQRIVGPDHGRAELADPADEAAHVGGIDRGALGGVLLVKVEAANVERAPVQLEAAADDRDIADAALGDVAAQPMVLLVAQRQRRLVQRGAVDRPEPRVLDGRHRLRGPGGMGSDRRSPEIELDLAVGAGQRHLLLGAGEVADQRLVLDRGVAGGARQDRPDLHLGDVDPLDRAQIHLAQQAAVVPPAAAGSGGQVALGAAVVDPHDQAVDAAAQPLEVELERQVGARVGADLAAVEPHRGPVVDGLEADDPAAVGLAHVARERLGREREVAAVPADRAVHARRRDVAGVVGVGNRHRGPAVGRRDVAKPALRLAHVGRVGAVQPGASEQIPAGLAVLVEGPLGGRGGGVHGTLGAGGGGQADQDQRRQGRRQRP